VGQPAAAVLAQLVEQQGIRFDAQTPVDHQHDDAQVIDAQFGFLAGSHRSFEHDLPLQRVEVSGEAALRGAAIDPGIVGQPARPRDGADQALERLAREIAATL